MFIQGKQTSIINEFNKKVDNAQKCIEKGIEILQELQRNYIAKKEENEKRLILLFKIQKSI